MTPEAGFTKVPPIEPFVRVIPMIYAYTTPNDHTHDGWVKIGYTDKQTVDERIKEQSFTTDTYCKEAWRNNAMYTDGSGQYFTDHPFHDFLVNQKHIERKPGKEWFKVSPSESEKDFHEFASRKAVVSKEHETYTLRDEQQLAVDMTTEYFRNGGTEFLWNAKPRFGKTLTAYDLIQTMGFKRVLIVTNRPAISNSWADDFFKFISWHGEYRFVSDSDAVKHRQGVITREQFIKSQHGDSEDGMITFVSLQDLKGAKPFGGKYDKLEWISKTYVNEYGRQVNGMKFDLLIVDEAHEGVDTILTERAFDNINRDHTLYLSGTPYKALADERFSKEQIFNWTYLDEQEAKDNWNSEDYNPYEKMPRLALYTYQLSDMIFDEIKKGIVLDDDDEPVDYAFDLNEFFAVDNLNHLIHEDEIKKFLHALTTQEKYPFSTPELRHELAHTLWRLNRVESARALARLLREDEVFGEYEIVLAAGDGKVNEDDEPDKAYDRVKKAIASCNSPDSEKIGTITLSVGQLTVGVTVPEWSGILMLCNLSSAEAYMQTTFRVQNPCEMTIVTDSNKPGERVLKQTAYVFDFDPARTLDIYAEFSDKMVIGKDFEDESIEREKNIRKLLNFFPVLGEDSEGRMIELDAEQVLSIPSRIKCQEVVRRGFMSNFLFQNISNIFGAPNAVREIIEKLTPAHEEPKKRDKTDLSKISDMTVDENGNAVVDQEIVIGTETDLFGAKHWEEIPEDIDTHIENISHVEPDSPEMDKGIDALVDAMKDDANVNIVAPIADKFGVTKGIKKRMEHQVAQKINREMDSAKWDYRQEINTAKAEKDGKLKTAETESEVHKIEQEYQSKTEDALSKLTQAVRDTVQKTGEEESHNLIQQMEQRQVDSEKKTIEDTVRDRLRGFSRTIPSFIMAYGDNKLTLANFDDYTEDDVFEEVTGIKEEDFRFLRDGGDYTDKETGEKRHYYGHLFNERVFNDSIQEFLRKKQELANYFDEAQDEDIFDYIPPQKTNQIFTPKWVVVKMVDELEENNPSCFDNPNNTFADLYMKSGLYITEIVKRLFRSEKMKELFPDDNDRLHHIFENQVYGMAPTRIIYLIATNYILGFDDSMKAETKNFVEADASQASKDGTLAELVDKYFG